MNLEIVINIDISHIEYFWSPYCGIRHHQVLRI